MVKIFITILISFCFCQFSPHFDGKLAYDYLLKQCDFGPRYPGSKEHIEFKDFLVKFLSDKGDSLIIDSHEIKHPYESKQIGLYNMLLRFNIDSDDRIMLMAHWDTREIADKDPNPENFDTPIIGANDGASGIAILMVLSEMLESYPLQKIGVDLLFVDGEDIGRSGELENFSLGTKAFSKSIKSPPKLAICLDMVADIDAEFKVEYFSYLQAPEAVEEIWSLANSLGYKEFTGSFQRPIYDDHRALFVETGIPSIDIIDFDYSYWHTLEDTPDKCSANTLKIVGHVVSEYLYRKDGM